MKRGNEETGQFSASANFPAKYGIFEFELELASSLFFFPSSFPFLRFERAVQKKTKHGQMLGREEGFARNTTSSQRKRSCAAK